MYLGTVLYNSPIMSTTTTKDLKGNNSPASSVESSTPVSAQKKQELLHRARRHRLHWVLQARDQTSSSSGSTSNLSNSASAIDLNNLPGARCMQEVLSFFNEVVNDGEDLDLDSLLLSIQDEHRAEEDETKLLDAFLESYKQQQSEQKASYEFFLQKLLQPQALPLVKSMQQFCTKFTSAFRHQRANTELHFLPSSSGAKSVEEEHKQRAQQIWTFLDHCGELMRDCVLWAEEDQTGFEESKLHCEKFVFIKLYPVLFATDNEDHSVHLQTSDRINTLAFITAEHLDIKSLHQLPHLDNNTITTNNRQSKLSDDPAHQVLLKAIETLKEMTTSKCPNDKLITLRKCSSAIAQALKESRRDGKLPGADELLPMMILTIKFCNLPFLHAHIKFLQRYTRPNKLVSEAGYLITNFVSAVFFLDNVDAAALTIQPEEFEKAVKAAKQRAKDRLHVNKEAHDFSAAARRAKEDEEDEPHASVNYHKLLAAFQEQVEENAKRDFVSIRDLWAANIASPLAAKTKFGR